MKEKKDAIEKKEIVDMKETMTTETKETMIAETKEKAEITKMKEAIKIITDAIIMDAIIIAAEKTAVITVVNNAAII